MAIKPENMALIDTIIEHIEKRIHNGELSNNDLIQLIDIVGSDYLQLKTISKKAKELNTDYNNVKCSRIEKVNLFGVKFVIDND
jgi:hypothetical protein